MTSFIDAPTLPLVLGGNVFGWTADRDASFAILDAFAEAGGTLIDTADSYSAWVDGNAGGESETLIGQWLASRHSSGVTVATKVSQHPQFRGLSGANVRAAAEASLKRLGVDAIDLYYAHFDDADTPLEETVSAFGALVDDGLVRQVAVSNYTAERIDEWLALAGDGPARPVAVQPHYNLVHRAEVESGILPLARREGLRVFPYAGLAGGFLTGKYRTPDAAGQSSPRAGGAAALATPDGLRLLEAMDAVADAHGTTVAAVALAWLRAQSGVTAPVASASRVAQVADLVAGARLALSADEVAALAAASEVYAAVAA